MNIRVIVSLLSFIILSNTNLKAQIKYENRLEFELKSGYDTDEILPLGENGFLMVSQNEKSKKGMTEWKYEFYLPNLEIGKTKSIYLDKDYTSSTSIETETRSHTLYKNFKKGKFTLVTYDASDHEITETRGELPKKISVRNSYVMGELFYVIGKVKDSPIIFSINWKTGLQKVIPISVPGIKPKKTTIIDFQTLNSSSEIFVFMKAYDSKKESSIHVLKFDDNAKKLEQYKLNTGSDKNLVSLSASKTADGEYILNGTYSSKTVTTSEGIFIAKVVNKKVDFIKFYNFLKLDDFLSYLPQKKQEKIKKKQSKKAKRGKELVINYLIASHDIIKTSTGYVFLGEAFYPTYRTETRTTFVNGQATTTTITVFDGYQYTHATAAKFDLEGNLIWDSSFEMRPKYKPFYPIRFISIAEQNDQSMSMVFANLNKIVSKSIDYKSGEILTDKTSNEIETGLQGDKTKKGFSNIDYWYDNYFLAYGTQKIKNKESGKRKVFFISKIAF